MFFLGGFNSIVPYLLYLSLMWFFVIIGFRGKIAETWHALNPREYHTENDIIKQPVSNTLLLTQKIVDHLNNNTDGCLHTHNYYRPTGEFIITVIPANSHADISLYLNSFFFRGPPARIIS